MYAPSVVEMKRGGECVWPANTRSGPTGHHRSLLNWLYSTMLMIGTNIMSYSLWTLKEGLLRYSKSLLLMTHFWYPAYTNTTSGRLFNTHFYSSSGFSWSTVYIYWYTCIYKHYSYACKLEHMDYVNIVWWIFGVGRTETIDLPTPCSHDTPTDYKDSRLCTCIKGHENSPPPLQPTRTRV